MTRPSGVLVGFVKKHGSVIVSLSLLVLVIVALHRVLQTIDFRQVIAHFEAIPASMIWLAAGSTIIGYAALIGYEWSAIRYLGKPIPLSVFVTTSMTAYAMSNTIGLALLTGGAVRHKLYRGLGVDAADIALITSFCALFFGLGVTLIGLAALVFYPAALKSVIPISADLVRIISLITLVVTILCMLWLSKSGQTFQIGRFNLGMPEWRILSAQLLFCALDISMTGFALFVLMPDSVAMPYMQFLGIFAIAAFISVLSHVPSGIGVFETIVIAAVYSVPADVPAIVAGLLAFRVAYYLIPFVISLSLLMIVGPLIRDAEIARRSV